MPTRRKRPQDAPTVQDAPLSRFHAHLLSVLEEKRAEEVVRLDVTEVTDLADEFVIATVLNQRQAGTIVEACEKERKRLQLPRVGMEGVQGSTWVVLDYGSIVVHLLTREARAYYDLENLWADARRVS
ncbi:MAG: ribosome silencing factor [Planctomycetota bacterium]